jgi:hypothetical protein
MLSTGVQVCAGEASRRQRPIGQAAPSGGSLGVRHRIELDTQAAGNVMKPPYADAPSRVKGQTLRLLPEIWLKLKLLAAILDAKRGTRVTQHDLLLEAVGDLLVKYRDELPGNPGNDN